MTFGQLSDLFMFSFLGGRFDTYHVLGNNVIQYTKLQVSKTAKPVALATVVYNQEGKTRVIDESNGEVQEFIPFSEQEYAEWKQSQGEWNRL